MHTFLIEARQQVARSLPMRWLWFAFPTIMIFHVPSEDWVKSITQIGSYHLQTSELAIACFGICCVVAASSHTLKAAFRSGLWVPWIAYVAAFAVSTVFASNRQLALIQDVMVVAGVLVASTVWLSLDCAIGTRRALEVIAAAGAVVTVVIAVLVSHATTTQVQPCPDGGLCLGGSLHFRAAEIGGHLYARGEIPGVDYNRTGMELVLSTLVALYLGRTARGRWPWLWNLVALISANGILFALSKGALLSFGIGLAVLLLSRWYSRWEALAALAVASILSNAITSAAVAGSQYLVATALRAVSILSFIPPVNRLLVKLGTLDTSDRLGMAESSVGYFRRHPLVGVGPLGLQNVETVDGLRISEHNEYIRALAETGLIGFAALVLVVITPVASIFVVLRHTKAKAISPEDLKLGHLLLAGLLALAVNFVVTPLEYSYWAWVGLSGAWLVRCYPGFSLTSILSTVGSSRWRVIEPLSPT